MGAVLDENTITTLNALNDSLEKDRAGMKATAREFSAQYSEIVRAWNVISDPSFLTICIGNFQRAVQSAAGFFGGVSEQTINEFNKLNGMMAAAGLNADDFQARTRGLATTLTVYKKYTTGAITNTTDAQIEAQKLVTQGYTAETWALKQLQDIQAEQDANVQAAYQTWAALNEQYLTQLDTTTKQYLSDIGGTFGAFPAQVAVSGEQLLINLQSQVDGLSGWTEDMKSLAGRVPEAFMQELRNLGPSAAAEVAGLSTMTGPELENYIALWGEKGTLAKDAAVTALAPLKDEAAVALNDLELAIAAEDTQMAIVGGALGKALGDGITAETAYIKSAARNAVDAAIQAAREEADAHSPSRRMGDEVGLDLGRGAGVGFIAGLEETLPSMREGLSGAIDSMAKAAESLYGSQNNYTYNNSRAFQITQKNYFSERYSKRDGAVAVRDLNRQLGRAYNRS
jgi:hypothetical protein